MILNVLLIVGGLVLLVATGVFLVGLRHAPLAVEDESGFHLIEKAGPVRAPKFDSTAAGAYSHPTPNAPVSVL